MMAAKAKLGIFLFLYFLVIVGIIMNIVRLICPFDLIADSIYTPVIIHRKNDLLLTHISQIVSDEDHIYVLYGDYSVVQAYSRDGYYQYSIAVYNHMNGRTKISVHDNHLCIQDKTGNVYIFKNEEFIRLVKNDEILDSDPVITQNNDPHYSIRGSSIWYTSENAGEYCVIERPAWLVIYQNDLLTLIIFVLVIIAGLILFAPRPPKRPI